MKSYEPSAIVISSDEEGENDAPPTKKLRHDDYFNTETYFCRSVNKQQQQQQQQHDVKCVTRAVVNRKLLLLPVSTKNETLDYRHQFHCENSVWDVSVERQSTLTCVNSVASRSAYSVASRSVSSLVIDLSEDCDDDVPSELAPKCEIDDDVIVVEPILKRFKATEQTVDDNTSQQPEHLLTSDRQVLYRVPAASQVPAASRKNKTWLLHRRVRCSSSRRPAACDRVDTERAAAGSASVVSVGGCRLVSHRYVVPTLFPFRHSAFRYSETLTPDVTDNSHAILVKRFNHWKTDFLSACDFPQHFAQILHELADCTSEVSRGALTQTVLLLLKGSDEYQCYRLHATLHTLYCLHPTAGLPFNYEKISVLLLGRSDGRRHCVINKQLVIEYVVNCLELGQLHYPARTNRQVTTLLSVDSPLMQLILKQCTRSVSLSTLLTMQRAVSVLSRATKFHYIDRLSTELQLIFNNYSPLVDRRQVLLTVIEPVQQWMASQCLLQSLYNVSSADRLSVQSSLRVAVSWLFNSDALTSQRFNFSDDVEQFLLFIVSATHSFLHLKLSSHVGVSDDDIEFLRNISQQVDVLTAQLQTLLNNNSNNNNNNNNNNNKNDTTTTASRAVPVKLSVHSRVYLYQLECLADLADL